MTRTGRGHDFTQGSTLRQLVVFSAPIMAANLLQTSFQIVDSLWIGNLLGADALAAVAVSAVIVFTALSFVIGMNNAALTILSQQRGRADERGLERYLNAFVVTLLVLSVVVGALGYGLSGGLLGLLGTPEEIVAPAQEYLRITFLGIPFLFGYTFLSTVLRAVGDSRTPMRFVLVAVLLNVVLDPLLIHVLGLGVRGAAVATVLSQGIAFGYGLVHVTRRRLVPFRRPTLPAGAEVRTILRLGIPAGLQMAVISAGAAAITSVVTGFGPAVLAGYGAAQRIDSLIMLPAQALGISVSSMAGQNIGTGNWDRVGRVSRVGVVYNLAIMTAVALVVVALARPAVSLFVREPDAVEFGTQYLRIVALCYPFLGINFVLNGVVRAAGAMYQVLVLNIISFWVLRFPLTALFARLSGESGIALGMGASFIVSSAIAFLYYRFGRWRETELFAEAERR
ncbi:putative efflux protein, MATE family [Georgenia satyanarayanai]|uniref:Putative efflux protein, MATE family n=1 Tax=Georgenia satyanarayanai TaxID=860221 RepID=A0A2Y9C2T2_9MICO|nr:MATE family efflux transporter [Georgenia satyanarayanai]PYG01830.1 putative MATE family efflux protein [Georgenia satyanarayanai]SSA36633.1 putative efflux protein, MATE family [Georgenia satyanarayanai]